MTVIDIANRRQLRATRKLIEKNDLYRRWAGEVVADEKSEIAYFHDRARIFFEDGSVRDVIGGQAPADWAKHFGHADQDRDNSEYEESLEVVEVSGPAI